MQPQRTCKLFGAIRAVLGVKNTIPLIHGPVGCTYHIRYLLGARSGTNVQIFSTELNQEDVVFGAEEKLVDKIIQMDNLYSPQLIVVLSSCSTSLIGEDIFRVAREVKSEINSEIIAISAGGFEGDQSQGYQEVMNALIDWSTFKLLNVESNSYNRLESRIKNKSIQLAARSRVSNSINLIGQFRGGSDLRNLKEVLQSMGVQVNCVLTSGTSLKEIETIPKAALNYSMCDLSGIGPCRILEERFGTPFLHYPFPMGFRNSSLFYENISHALGMDCDWKEKEHFKSILNDYKHKLKGYNVAIIAGSTRAVALTGFALEMDMKPVLISMDLVGEYTLENLHNVLDGSDFKPKILASDDFGTVYDYLRQENPDIILAGLGEIGISRELGIPLLDVMHAQEITMGWEGSVEMAKNISHSLGI